MLQSPLVAGRVNSFHMVSKQEQKVHDFFLQYFSRYDVKKSTRPDFLKNETTGKNLEIDVYLPRFHIGFEYQGGVHFNDIRGIGNDADKSRKNDYIKSELSLNFKRTFSIVELFPTDLTGDIKANIIHRIENTIQYYLSYDKRLKAARLEQLRIYLTCGIITKGIIAGKFNLYDQIEKKPLNLNYGTVYDIVHRGEFKPTNLKEA
jgi:hypothetical protein